MVKITNGIDTFEVTKGAFDGIYSRQGYFIDGNENKSTSDKVEASGDEPELSEDEQFIQDMVEKPIAQWSKDEIKRFCELENIDISGTKNAGEARNIIKQFIESQKG